MPNQDDVIILDPSQLKKAKTWEDFISLWFMSKELDQRNQWFKGDIALLVATKWGEGSLNKFGESVDESKTTLENYRRVSRAFPVGKRGLNLEWTHYYLASYTDSFRKGLGRFVGQERFDWINKAHDNSWTTVRMAEEIKKKKAMKGKGEGATFSYYEEYLKKVRNILMHIDRDDLNDKESERLIHKLLDIYNEFMVYLKE